MLFTYIMKDLSIILCLLLAVIFLSNCTYMFYRRANIDKIENYENSQRLIRKRLTDEQLEAKNVMDNMIKNSNMNISNSCKLINDFCIKDSQNEICNDERYFNSIECNASLNFCEDSSIVKQCNPEEELAKWIISLSVEDRKKFSDAVYVLRPELRP